MDQLEQLAEEFVAADEALTAAKAVKTLAEARAAKAKASLYEAITQRSLRSFDHVRLGKFRPRLEPHVSLKKASLGEDGEVQDENSRAELEAWAKTVPIGDGMTLFDVLFYFAVKNARLKSLVKERLEEGLEMPPGVEKWDEKTITWKPSDEYKETHPKEKK